jgi:flagellar motor switch protein FliG
MLHFMDKESREKLLANLAKKDPVVAQEIKQKMFVFEDLLSLDGAKIQFLLKEVPGNQLRLALRTASEELLAKILANMPERAANLLREDLASQGPQRQSVVTNAQMEIADLASRLFSKAPFLRSV